MKGILILMMAVLINLAAIGQQNNISGSAGVSFQYHINYESGFLYGRDIRTTMEKKDHKKMLGYIKIASEFYYASKTLFVGPKLSFEGAWRSLGARISAIDYVGDKEHDYRITPEFGFSQLYLARGKGYLNIFYGNNIPIGSSRIYDVPRNRITICYNCWLVVRRFHK